MATRQLRNGRARAVASVVLVLVILPAAYAGVRDRSPGAPRHQRLELDDAVDRLRQDLRPIPGPDERAAEPRW